VKRVRVSRIVIKRALLLGTLAVGLLIGLGSGSGAVAAGSPPLVVRELSSQAHVKATVSFTNARCRQGARAAQIAYLVTAKSTDRRWSLSIEFPRFTGRHRYEIPFGSSDTDPHVTFDGPDGEFSSLNRPRRSFSGPGFVTLGPRGAVQLGDGYIANQDFSGSVAAVGTLHCPVPRRQKGR
jgi:hypothetical protein